MAIRVTSVTSWFTSEFRDWRSLAEFVAFADWIASSRIRCRISPDCASAPSAVCDSEMPSFALRRAWSRPRICEVMRSEIARPAASSFAELMRRPEDRRCSAVARLLCDVVRLRCAFSEAMLVLITWDMKVS